MSCRDMLTPQGGYISGSSREPRFDGNAFIRDHNDILLVTYNYRVSLWGFPAGSGTASAALNAGLQDQRMVVEWVRDNIEAFGGVRFSRKDCLVKGFLTPSRIHETLCSLVSLLAQLRSPVTRMHISRIRSLVPSSYNLDRRA